MGLTNFEGFERYSSYKDVGRLLNMPSGNLFPGTSNLPISVESSTLLYGQNVNNKNNLPNLKFLKVDTASSSLYASIVSNPSDTSRYNLNKYFTPLANIPFKKNIEHGIIGFSIFPALPSGGTYGALGNELEFAPIALLTDSGYFPGLILSINSSGQVILSHYNSSTLFNTSRIDMYDTNATYGITLFNLQGATASRNLFDQNGNPKNLTSTVTPTFPIYAYPDSLYGSLFNGFDYPANYNDLIAPILAITPNTNNRLYFNYWNYIEIEFDLRNNREQFKIRINRNETSRKIDGSFGPFNSGLPLVSGVAQSGTISNPATVSGTGNSFTILQDGTMNLTGTIGEFNRGYAYVNNKFYASSGVGGGSYVSGEDEIGYLRLKLPVRKGTKITGYNDASYTWSVTASVTNYQPRSRTLSNIAFGQMKFYPSTHPHTTVYSTLIDDVYVIDCEDGLSPSGFLGPIACRKTNFNTTIANTAGSGTLAQASETFAGTTSLLDSIIFDRLDQSGVFRNTSFSSSESGIKEEVLAIQNTIYGFSLNNNDFITYSVLQDGSGLPSRSGTLGTNRIDGGVLFSPIYTTLPNGVALSGLTSDSGIQELQYLFTAKSDEEE